MTINEPVKVGRIEFTNRIVKPDIPRREDLESYDAIQVTGGKRPIITIEGWITDESWVTEIDDLLKRYKNETPITLDIEGDIDDWIIISLSWTREGGSPYTKFELDLIRKI